MKNHQKEKRNRLTKLFLFLSNIYFIPTLFSQEPDFQQNKIFENPLLFIAFLVLVFFVYRYLDEKKKKRKR